MKSPVRHHQSKGFNGWEMETRFHGTGWYILTMKRHGGALVTTARKVKFEEGGGHSYTPGQDESFSVLETRKRCTERNVRDQHQEALKILFSKKPHIFRREIRVTYEDGNTMETAINGTPESIRDHYIGHAGFEFEEGKPLVKAVKVEFIDCTE